jgi:hydrogenase expression/formation protein HypE
VALAVGKFAFVPIEGMGVPGRVVGIELEEHRVPVREDVRGACEILGFDPLYVANEGKLVAFVVGRRRRARAGGHARARPGRGGGAHRHRHRRASGAGGGADRIGGSRVLEKPYGELLPRIC